MKLHQLKSLLEVVDSQFSVSVAASKLFVAQSAISTHLKQVEEELGFPIFIRKARKLVGLTEPGEKAVALARRIMRQVVDTGAGGVDPLQALGQMPVFGQCIGAKIRDQKDIRFGQMTRQRLAVGCSVHGGVRVHAINAV